MTPINSGWNEKKTVKKGNVGEEIVREYLEAQQYIVYSPPITGPHCFDKLAVKNKKEMLIAEVKTKAARLYYPDTGFNLKNYLEYQAIQEKYNVPIFVFFVDEKKRRVYGNWLQKLEIPIIVKYNGKLLSYPLIDKEIIYFPIIAMIDIAGIDDMRARQMECLTATAYMKSPLDK